MRPPLARRGVQRAVQRAGERPRQLAAAALQRRQRPPDAPHGRGRRGPAHGVDAAQRLVQHERQRVQVGLLCPPRDPRSARGHVGERAEHVAGASERFLADEARAAEVGQLGSRHQRLGRRVVLREVGHEHVLRLDVAVDHPARVGVARALGERQADLQDLFVLERLRGDQLGEGLAVDELRDQIEGVVDRARLVQRDDRRV